MHSDVLIVARPDRHPRIAVRGRSGRAQHRAGHRAPGVGRGDAAGRRHDRAAGDRRAGCAGCGCVAPRRRWHCPAAPPPSRNAHLAPGGGGRSRPRSAAHRGRGQLPACVVDSARRLPGQGGSGCANAFRSAEPMSDRAFGRARCTPMSTATAVTTPHRTWRGIDRPTTSSVAPLACVSELRYPEIATPTRLGTGARDWPTAAACATWQGDAALARRLRRRLRASEAAISSSSSIRVRA